MTFSCLDPVYVNAHSSTHLIIKAESTKGGCALLFLLALMLFALFQKGPYCFALSRYLTEK